jgi:hypothetical protein
MSFVRCLVVSTLCGLVLPAQPSETAAAMCGMPSSQMSAASDHTIAQIAPAAAANVDPDSAALESFDQPRGWRARKARAAAPPSYRTLADALIEPPGPGNLDVIKEFGLPVIEGVPPIHMLLPQNGGNHERPGVHGLFHFD